MSDSLHGAGSDSESPYQDFDELTEEAARGDEQFHRPLDNFTKAQVWREVALRRAEKLRQAQALLTELAKPLARSVTEDAKAYQALGRAPNAATADLFDRVTAFLAGGESS